MNRPKAAGTRWETELVGRIQNQGLLADRLAEGGTNDLGDVWINHPPTTDDDPIVVLAWKRLTGNGQRRTPDGERDVVVLTVDDFLTLIEPHVNRGFVVEAKARQALNVTRTLAGARQKATRR